jgi:FkbM family methyltransferase
LSSSDLTYLTKLYRIRTIVDIGANSGDYGEYLRDLFNAETVHSFEPNPKYSEMLQARGFDVHAVALGEVNLEQAEFRLNHFDAASSLHDITLQCIEEFPQTKYCNSIMVPVRRLDSLIGEVDHDLLIKVDAQGFESEIIRGGLGVFAKADVVLIGMCFEPLYAGQALFNEVHELLAGVGLHFVGIKQQHLSKRDGRPLFAHCVYTRNRETAASISLDMVPQPDAGPLDLLVTTFAALLRVKLDPVTYSLLDTKIVHEGAGSYFGITWDKQHYYILARNYDQTSLGNRILIFDRDLHLTSEIDCSEYVREGHQIRAIGDKLLICNTNRNCVTTIGLTDGLVEHFFPLPDSTGTNINHFNTLSLHDGRLWIVAANRYRNSFFMCYEWPTMRLLDVDAVGLAAHNLIEWKGWKAICDSYHGAIVLTKKGYDKDKREYPMHVMHLLADSNEVNVETIGMSSAYFRERRGAHLFPRGLAITGDLALIGISEFTKRSMRKESLSRLMVIDSLEQVARSKKPTTATTIDLGNFGAVMDIRILNRADLGHDS